jgi:hypothetical protein
LGRDEREEVDAIEERRLVEAEAAGSVVDGCCFGDSTPLHRPHDGQQEYQLDGRLIRLMARMESAKFENAGISALLLELCCPLVSAPKAFDSPRMNPWCKRFVFDVSKLVLLHAIVPLLTGIRLEFDQYDTNIVIIVHLSR